jgi:hypothetical protein
LVKTSEKNEDKSVTNILHLYEYQSDGMVGAGFNRWIVRVRSVVDKLSLIQIICEQCCCTLSPFVLPKFHTDSAIRQMTDNGPVSITQTLRQSCCEAREKRKWPTTGNQGQHRIINLLEEVYEIPKQADA